MMPFAFVVAGSLHRVGMCARQRTHFLLGKQEKVTRLSGRRPSAVQRQKQRVNKGSSKFSANKEVAP
jgi:hypothetical protein